MAKKKKSVRDAEKRRREFDDGQRRIARRRNLVGFVGFIPLAASLGCGSGIELGPVCALPTDIWLLIWAALFGSFLGLTIRLILERRRFERETRAA